MERGSKGVVPVYPEIELIGTRKLAKETAKSILEKQAAKKAEREVLAQRIITNNVYRDSAPSQIVEQTYQKAALSSTNNSTSKEVILDKYINNSVNSYEAIAKSRNATYFSMSDWSTVSSQFGAENMWNINKAFLDQQIKQDKKFIFTADPRAEIAGYFTKLEYQHLINKGYKLELSKGGFYNAVKK